MQLGLNGWISDLTICWQEMVIGLIFFIMFMCHCLCLKRKVGVPWYPGLTGNWSVPQYTSLPILVARDVPARGLDVNTWTFCSMIIKQISRILSPLKSVLLSASYFSKIFHLVCCQVVLRRITKLWARSLDFYISISINVSRKASESYGASFSLISPSPTSLIFANWHWW